jgi:hypothetical protein
MVILPLEMVVDGATRPLLLSIPVLMTPMHMIEVGDFALQSIESAEEVEPYGCG